MSAFEDLLCAPELAFAGTDVPDAPERTPRPGGDPGRPDGYRRPAGKGISAAGDPGDATGARWRSRARYEAERARELVQASGRTPTALARLAQACLGAEEPQQAVLAATEALDSIVSGYERGDIFPGGQYSVDVSVAVAAADVLILAGQRTLAEERLAQLPPSLPVLLLRATIAVDAGRLAEALELLADDEARDSPLAGALRGWILLRLDRPQAAVRELRKAVSAEPGNEDSCLTLAAAFWQLGSRRKAIALARQAAALSPGRKVIRLALVDYLTSSGELRAADDELRGIVQSGFDDEPDLVLRRARVRLLAGDTDRGLTLLRRAAGMGQSSGDEAAAASASAKLALAEYGHGRIDRAEATRRVRRLRTAYPESIPVANAFAAMCVRTPMLPELRQVRESLRAQASGRQLMPVELRIADLEGRYEDLAAMAGDWAAAEPLNPAAANFAMLWTAYVSLDWAGAAERGASLVQRFPGDAVIANNAAYLSVLAGKLSLADRALGSIDVTVADQRHEILATRGLIDIAKGNLQAGLRGYRRASELAEKGAEGSIRRAEVSLAQGLALRLLGSCGEASSALRAGALPAVSLPANWPEISEFRQVRWLCEQTGCKWPPFVD